jgi:serine O-acetyltransferase
MQLSLSKQDLQSYVSSQLNNFFPDKHLVRLSEYGSMVDIAIDRVDNCFRKVAYGRYNKDGQTILNHLYIDQYLVFVWFLSNTFWKEKENSLVSTKLYYLNKALHGFDCMYDTQLPDIFLIFHGGTGTLLGKATYSDYLVVLHGCTIGSHKGKYPTLGKGVSLTAHSSIIGDCKIGDNVSISNNTSVFQKDVPSNTVAFINRETGQLNLKESSVPYSKQFFIEEP